MNDTLWPAGGIRPGYGEGTDGNVVDHEVIRRRINELGERLHIREIAVDRWNTTQLSTQLSGDSFEMVAFGQGYASMSAPMKELEKRILERERGHGGHPVLRGMASNVSASTDPAGNIKPDKARSTEKIDGIVAACMALGRLTLAEEDTPSRIATEGFALV